MISHRSLKSAIIIIFLLTLGWVQDGISGGVEGFLLQVSLAPRGVPSMERCIRESTSLRMSDTDEDRLRALGYTEEEIRQSKKKASESEELKVRVDLIDNVDPFSLTAVGFGLIALNFLVFANMGDGGIAGLVATIINTMNQ